MTSGKQYAREIFLQTLSSIDIAEFMEWKLPVRGTELVLPKFSVDLAGVPRVQVVALGKAAHAMVTGLLNLLPDGMRVEGVVTAPTFPAMAAKHFAYFAGGHPLPNEASLEAARAILDLLQRADERTLVFFLLSGGGSALMELPLVPEMNLAEVQAMHRALVVCGASIEEMNTVRRHLSAVKGGRLAAAAGRARKITLAVTDVPAGKEAALASGPTLPDPTTVADALGIIERYALRGKFPARLVEWLDAGAMPETPKSGDTAFANADFILLMGMDELFHAGHHAAEGKGYVTCCDNSTDDWPVEKAAENLLGQLESWQRENPGQKVAVLADGEVSSPVTGSGIGGRNSAFVLACVERIAGRKITVLSAGTDGVDGNSPAAGAVADGETLGRAEAMGLDARAAFANSDAYGFFSALGDAVVTGPTGNNLRDLRVFLMEP